MQKTFTIIIVITLILILIFLFLSLTRKRHSYIRKSYPPEGSQLEGFPLKGSQVEGYQSVFENLKYIIGPVSGSYHVSKKFTKKIYVFGDIHVKKIVCPRDASPQNTIKMIDFLIELANQKDEKDKPRQLDYFLEATSEDVYTREILDGFARRGTPIDEVILKFMNCLRIVKDECQYKNVRFHYTDIRISNEELKEVILLGLQLTMLIQNSQDINLIRNISSKINWEKIKRILANVEKIFKESKVDKQIQNITIPIVKELMLKRREIVIAQFFELFMAIDVIQKIIENNLLLNIRSNPEILDVYIRFVNLIQDSTAEIMDIYLFSRMFREFRGENDEKEESKEIVIYVGEHHADRYRLYLSALGFQQENYSKSETKGENYQCLEISSFKPFWV